MDYVINDYTKDLINRDYRLKLSNYNDRLENGAILYRI